MTRLTAAEAQALLDARESTGAWDAGAESVYAGHDTCPRHRGDAANERIRCECRSIARVDRDGDRSLMAAAPALVESLVATEAERDAIDADREALWSGVWSHVEPVGLDTPRDRAEVIARVAAVVAERDGALTRLSAVRETIAGWAHGEDCPAGDHGDCDPDEEGGEGCHEGLTPDECRARGSTCECGTAALRTLLRDEPASDARTLGEARATAEKLRADVAFWRRSSEAARGEDVRRQG